MKNDFPENFKNDDADYEISPEGSLGLLALGYKGIMAWRSVRDAKIPVDKKEKESNELDLLD